MTAILDMPLFRPAEPAVIAVTAFDLQGRSGGAEEEVLG